MTFGLTSMLFLLALAILVFVLFSAAAADAEYKLNLGDDEKPKKRKPDWANGQDRQDIYLDSDNEWPIYKI